MVELMSERGVAVSDRAVDRRGLTVDVVLSEHRDMIGSRVRCLMPHLMKHSDVSLLLFALEPIQMQSIR